MVIISKKFVVLSFILISFLFTGSKAIAKEATLYFDFNSIPSHQLTDKINMRFTTSSQFTVIQWNLKKRREITSAFTSQ